MSFDIDINEHKYGHVLLQMYTVKLCIDGYNVRATTIHYNSPVTGEFPSQRPVTQSFDAFFHLRLNNRLSEQSRGW